MICMTNTLFGLLQGVAPFGCASQFVDISLVVFHNSDLFIDKNIYKDFWKMAEQVDSSDYEFLEDSDHVNIVATSARKVSTWVDPGVLKLTHRIGRGSFGDVWLATHHRSTADYEEYHEVAVKMLNPIKDDQIEAFLAKFENLFLKCQGLKSVCYLHGISVIKGRICILMRFYEGSVGDKMTHFKGSKLPLPDVLRYVLDIAQGILELHAKEILSLNLKPCNFLLDDNDQALLGDFGVPFLLRDTSLPSSNMILRLGSPNYMSPEQWQPEIAGPLSYETDSWGLACSILEMLTGKRPWGDKSPEEIFQLVVLKKKSPSIPSGLPKVIENVLSGCFEYDLRYRPLAADVLQAFRRCQDAIKEENGWSAVENNSLEDNKSLYGAYSKWFLLKDIPQVGDLVRSRKPPNSCKPESMHIPGGTLVGSDGDEYVLVRVHGVHDPLRVHLSTLERVTSGFAAGDWVRMKTEDKKQSPVGILHSIDRDGKVAVAFIGLETLWKGHYSELQMAESYCVGQFIKLKANVFNPRFDWPRKGGGEWATGIILHIYPNGCLVVKFPGRLVFKDETNYYADPAEVEAVSFDTCVGVVKKYQHLEDYHWIVRPLVIVAGLLTAYKFGAFIVKNVGRHRSRSRSRPRKKKSVVPSVQNDDDDEDGQHGGNPAWLPPPVANFIFREGPSPTR